MGRENLNMVIALPAVEARKARADQLSCGVARSSILGQRLTIYALRSHGRFTLLSGRVPRRVPTADMPLLPDGIAGNLPLPVRTCVFRDRRKRRSAGHGSPLLLGFPLCHPAAYPIGDR